MDTKKGCGFATVYPIEALQCLYTINASDPRPEMGNMTAQMCGLSKYVQKNHASMALQTHSRERSPCPRVIEICRFRLENKS
ncbi:MAG: hypothetical protein MJZ22_04415 [Candidatus Saccharibacteria bacterium]|nr:hypothetical protein [Candidatus Saccharibacteria bacterium]